MKRRFVVAALCALAIAVTGCRKQETIVKNIVGPSPAASSAVTGVTITPGSETITGCEKTVIFTAMVQGPGAVQNVAWELAGSALGAGSFTPAGMTATLVIRSTGSYAVKATATQANGNGVFGTVTINAIMDCGGTPAPAPGPSPGPVGPHVFLSANPMTVAPGGFTDLDSSTSNVTSCVASGGWSGSKPVTPYRERVTLLVTTTFYLTCTDNEGRPGYANVTVTVTGATPGPVPQCRNGVDDDGDGKIDYPADPGCSSPDDPDERDTAFPPPSSGTCTLTQPLTPSSGSGSVNSTMTVHAAWSGASCPGWYYSLDPSRVGVNATTGVVKFVFPGTTTICAQPAVNMTEQKTCGTFTTTP